MKSKSDLKYNFNSYIHLLLSLCQKTSNFGSHQEFVPRSLSMTRNYHKKIIEKKKYIPPLFYVKVFKNGLDPLICSYHISHEDNKAYNSNRSGI
jgi:hypothetical protein